MDGILKQQSLLYLGFKVNMSLLLIQEEPLVSMSNKGFTIKILWNRGIFSKQ